MKWLRKYADVKYLARIHELEGQLSLSEMKLANMKMILQEQRKIYGESHYAEGERIAAMILRMKSMGALA